VKSVGDCKDPDELKRTLLKSLVNCKEPDEFQEDAIEPPSGLYGRWRRRGAAAADHGHDGRAPGGAVLAAGTSQ
jgi:hypothetical protein